MLIFKTWKIKNKIKIIHNSISRGIDGNIEMKILLILWVCDYHINSHTVLKDKIA